VHSYHHQGVAQTGDGLTVAAQSPDGLVEAVELPGPTFGIGVLWHSEVGDNPSLLRALVTAAAGG